MQKSIIVSLSVAAAVFIIKYALDYYTISERIKADPMNSFPPSAAWITALPWAITIFIIIILLSLPIWPQQLKSGVRKESTIEKIQRIVTGRIDD